ncbi:MAG: glycosyltransferase [Cyclobacteriaceae bacterium]|nr:glycosyltransferase [Cyclobacteriaceae bacterium]
MSPLISVYITNYNYARFLKKAIDSVLSQSFHDYELLIIDDGSTDDSKNIIEGYASNPKIKIIYQHNKGLNVTNNIAIRAASGKYIIRLDADDHLVSNALEQMSGKLEANHELGMIFPNYYYIDEKDQVIGEEVRHDFDNNKVSLLDQPAHGACTMIRTDFLNEIGGYDESFNCQDGYELWIKFTQRYKVTNLKKPLFYYRKHGENLTSNEEMILQTRAKINQKYINKLQTNNNTLAIIPIRGGDKDLAFQTINGVNILTAKINMLLRSTYIEKIIVSSPDSRIEKYITAYKTKKNVLFHFRNETEARINDNLNATIFDISNKFDNKVANLAIITLEYPLIRREHIDDAINTMALFGTDSIISVRPDNAIFYQHHGDGLHPILNRDKFTKLEREALFKQLGGITVVRKVAFDESKQMLCGKVGHVVIDQKAGLGLFSNIDFEIIRYYQKNQNSNKTNDVIEQ